MPVIRDKPGKVDWGKTEDTLNFKPKYLEFILKRIK